VCSECEAWSDHEARGWIALIGIDPDDQEPPSVQIFCPECAEEEFAYRARREDSEDRN